MKKGILYRIIISAILLIAIQFLPINNNIILGLIYLIPYLIIGYDVIFKAVRGIINGQILDENFLMAVASIGAIFLGFFWNSHFIEAPLVLFFYQVGEYFQSVAVRKSRKNIESLLKLSPEYANLELGGETVRVSPEEVEVGSIIVVRTGEKIAIDGVVVDGSASLSTLAMTGESDLTDVGVDDEVISGTICESGVIKIKTTKAYSDSTVMKVLELVEKASGKKAKTERFISKFAYIYTPIVCGLALLIACVPALIGWIFSIDVNFLEWIYRGLSFLVISCPCALVISVPLSFFSCIGGLGRGGVLIKGSGVIENLAKVKTVIFDKTGTLTDGKIKIKDIYFENIKREEFIQYLVLLESRSIHPIAKSIIKEFNIPVDFDKIKEYNEIGGLGITAKIDDKALALGNYKLMESLGVKIKDGLERAIYLAVDGEFTGYITFSDSLKENAKTALNSLKKQGINKIVMLTGDGENRAKAIAYELEISEYYFGLLPDQKQEKTERFLGGKEKVAFVGDGVNDAPTLLAVDVGIAMGALGSDLAIESASVVIMDDDINKVSSSIKSAKKCMKIIIENIAFSLAVKFAVLILSALGVGNLMLAIFADVGVMVLAILNSFRALKIKK